MNSFINFLKQAGSRYSYLDTSYGYYGEVSLSSTYPVDPCVRNNNFDGDDSGPDLGVDATLDSQHSEERFTCTSLAEADDVRIWKGSSGYTTVLFFNLGDGDLSIKEVEWALRRISDSASSLQLPALIRQLVVAPFANTSYTGCADYTQPDHRAVHVGAYSIDISSVEQVGSTCDTDPEADQVQIVPTTDWNYLFKSNSSTTAYSYHDRHYGWLLTGLWSFPYTSGKCTVTDDHWAGEENCVFSRIQNYWSQF
jgi:hypothetical protein